MTNENTNLHVEDLRAKIDSIAPMGFRTIDEAKKLANHFKTIINDPVTQSSPKILKYLTALDERNKQKFLKERDEVEVEYIFPSEMKNNQQRQRFNSLSVMEVSDLLNIEFANSGKSVKVHICTECDVEIDTNNDLPLMESLQKHFNLEVHQPKRLRSESCDVSEPIVLPNLSRRKSAMVERGEAVAPATMEQLDLIFKKNLTTNEEKPDKLFMSKLETFLVRHLTDNSNASLDSAVNFYQSVYGQICKEISTIDLPSLANMVAPVIASIRDNVYQHVATEDTNKQQTKKLRYYQPIESAICNFLTNHKLISLVDDRTAKPAFFCMACEYYTLKFRYDSVLTHVFSDTHLHNLSNILESDVSIPFIFKSRSYETIKSMNDGYLLSHEIMQNNEGTLCYLCNNQPIEDAVVHILDETHLGRMSDKIYQCVRGAKSVPDEWGQKAMDWGKHLANTGRVSLPRDTIMIENFIRPSGKLSNTCPSCDMVLKGPRYLLFNHVRQKKHIRNVAPEKLKYLFKNHCRPAQYFASSGKYFLCSICPEVALPSFAAVVEHAESDGHVEGIAKLVKIALTGDEEALRSYGVEDCKCAVCDLKFEKVEEIVKHMLSDFKHGNLTADLNSKRRKKDVIAAYMKGDLVLYTDTGTFICDVCNGMFGIRALMMHLMYAEHLSYRPSAENMFRFYLELKTNIVMITRNKYARTTFDKIYCRSCERYIDAADNAKEHCKDIEHKKRVAAAESDGAEQLQDELE